LEVKDYTGGHSAEKRVHNSGFAKHDDVAEEEPRKARVCEGREITKKLLSAIAVSYIQ
jgi:hypothetical protein